ncbi:MAG: HAMP domain-containing histidine kinase [Planctomycetes bacterium]|nr:HAMP domain-containing histidine kinase [Planctomycetota bacterium]MBU4400069.1 HAMP domain-containing histidine kinase [Planctomycetota bacterium]MCG2683859.1 HAMP domain-containing histidine kinase [Planctomycetales bacterium]
MLSNCPIRRKLLLGLALLVLVVAILSSTGLVATYAYRNLVNSLSWRVSELPLAAELSSHVSDLRITIGELRGLRINTFPDTHHDLVPMRVRMARDQFRGRLDEVDRTLERYRDQLAGEARADPRMSDHQRERETVRKIEAQLERIRTANRDEDWMLDNVKIGWLDVELEQLQILASELPSHLHSKLAGFSHEVRGQYRVLIVSAWTATVSAGLIFLLFMRLSYRWVFRPLRMLIAGSRRVAAGEFSYRIRLDTEDEMAELAKAMNDMTARFQEIRDDLDRQVQVRTKQVVRSEQLASVGFLAAGVAHEINNPLASIAICAESLEGRLQTTLDENDPEERGTGPLCRNGPEGASHKADLSPFLPYLRMIQTEAFRCKGITEKLLDFSRIGPGKREETELGELVRDVIDMIGHLGKYQRKHVEFAPAGPVPAKVNPQEIKQSVLNLLSNALDSSADGGTVRVGLETREGSAVLTVSDDGCGMTPEVLEHVFEPFFTRRRGGQGIGLGLSITYRIIADHGGEIEAQSAGAGRGSTFRIRLPLAASRKETDDYFHSRAA